MMKMDHLGRKKSPFMAEVILVNMFVKSCCVEVRMGIMKLSCTLPFTSFFSSMYITRGFQNSTHINGVFSHQTFEPILLWVPPFPSCSHLTEYSFNPRPPISLERGKEKAYQPLVKDAWVSRQPPGESSPLAGAAMHYAQGHAHSSEVGSEGHYKGLSIWPISRQLGRTIMFLKPDFLCIAVLVSWKA